jgi:ribonucleoside-diphosphate reductase alpha chain
MGVIRIDHPDIEEFIRAKQNTNRLRGFNLSVAVTDEFMHHLDKGTPFPLYFEGEVYKEVDPSILWETLMRSTWDWGEPGVLFIDRINEMNNLWYCETIAATNPCGEQPLPPNGACLLGSFNLVKYLRNDEIDMDQFAYDIDFVVRAMDNVIDKASYPLYEQEKEAKSKRRMGLGVTGLANALESLGYRYGSPEFLDQEEVILSNLRAEAYMASCRLAKEKGSFPMYNEERYLKGEFVKTLPLQVQEAIKQHGIRNSHLLSIAPTGTISMTADNVSSGIEPVMAYVVDRTVFMDSEPKVVQIEDYGKRVFGVEGKTVDQVTIGEHLSVLATAVPYIDSSISKTCNVPSNMDWADFKNVYIETWKLGCKGCTTYQMGGKREGVITACTIDPDSGQKECD